MWMYIVAAFLLGLVSILLSPVVIGISYDQTLRVWVRFWFFRFWVYPQKKAPKTKKVKKGKKSDKKKDQKPSAVKGLIKKHGVAGTLRLAVQGVSVLSRSFFRLLKNARIRRLNLELGITGRDAADAAIQYGQVCSVLYPALGGVAQHMKLIGPQVNVYCDYSGHEPTVKGSAKVYISVYHAVGTALFACKEFILK